MSSYCPLSIVMKSLSDVISSRYRGDYWKQFEQMLLSQCYMNVTLTITDILLGCTREKYHALNLMILLIKQ